MMDSRITPHMVSQAQVLLARSARWSRRSARTPSGALVNVVTFSSSRTKKDGSTVVYLTRCDGAVCSCPGFQVRQACSHAVATRMDAERARAEAAIKAPSTLDRLYDNHLVDAF